jgi:hypothetical protein
MREELLGEMTSLNKQKYWCTYHISNADFAQTLDGSTEITLYDFAGDPGGE